MFTENGCTCKGTHVLAFQSTFQDFASVNKKITCYIFQLKMKLKMAKLDCEMNG